MNLRRAVHVGMLAPIAFLIAVGAAAEPGQISASPQWSAFVFDRGVASEQVDLLGNQLVVAVSARSTKRLAEPSDLASDDVHKIALADPASVNLEKPLGPRSRSSQPVAQRNGERLIHSLVRQG